MNFDDYENYDDSLHDRIHLLPAWFCERMLAHDGKYVFLLEGGISVTLTRIQRIHQDNASRVWLDVTLMPYAEAEAHLCAGGLQNRPFVAATDKHRNATVSASSIMVAYEMGAVAAPEAAATPPQL